MNLLTIVTSVRVVVGVVIAGLIAKGFIDEGIGSTIENVLLVATGWLVFKRPMDVNTIDKVVTVEKK